jgi:hypothetical protein
MHRWHFRALPVPVILPSPWMPLPWVDGFNNNSNDNQPSHDSGQDCLSTWWGTHVFQERLSGSLLYVDLTRNGNEYNVYAMLCILRSLRTANLTSMTREQLATTNTTQYHHQKATINIQLDTTNNNNSEMNNNNNNQTFRRVQGNPPS